MAKDDKELIEEALQNFTGLSGHNKKAKERMLLALVKSLGIVTTACRMAKVGKSTHYDWKNDDPEYKRLVEEIDDIAIDFAESKLHKRIEDGDTTAIIFYLKTKAKKRGYGDQMSVDLNVHKMPKVQIGLKVHKRKEE